MSSPSRRSIVFDLDGTLLDSLPLVLAAIRHAIEPFGGTTTMEIFAHLGGPPQRFMANLLQDPAHLPEALARMRRYHDENLHLIQPYAGARALLETLARRGVSAAVWTGRDRASTEVLLKRHTLDALLAAVVCGDDLPSHKPDPAGLQAILSSLGLAPGEALLVGDADVDVLGGHACGVDTALIRHQRNVAEEIVARSWQVFASPQEAYAAVLQVLEPGLPRPV
jgi:HAD superfamily hydrolase (TIGR01509 family)